MDKNRKIRNIASVEQRMALDPSGFETSSWIAFYILRRNMSTQCLVGTIFIDLNTSIFSRRHYRLFVVMSRGVSFLY